jgi:Protein of unknown function DUF262
MTERNLSPADIKLEGIAHVLRDRRLQVPAYQRSYSWDQEEVNDFWWDLRAAFGTERPQYFLGTIVLTEDRDTGLSAIIDGQQRLTTTSLLLLALRNEFLRRGDPERAQVIERDYEVTLDLRSGNRMTRMTLSLDDQPHYRSVIDNGPREGTTDARPFDTSSRIVKALLFLEEQVRSEARNAGPHWAETLFRWVEFLERQVGVITVAVATESDAFLIFETLNARGRELTVADLLKNYLFGLSGSAIDRMQEHWMSALQALSTSADEEIFTTYLRHLWNSFNGATREREMYSKIKAAVTAKKTALELGSRIETFAPLYAALLSAEQPYWTSHANLQPLAETLQRLGLEQNRPLLLAAMNRFGPEDLGALMKAVICWSVRGLVVGGIGGGTMERAYAEAAVALSEGRARDTTAVFHELSAVIPTDASFQEAFSARRINRTTIAKYLLVALTGAEQGIPDAYAVPNTAEAGFRLEAKLPRNADAGAWPQFEPDEISQWALRLGNLFVTEPGELVPTATPMTDMLNVAVWSPAAISARQERLAQLAVGLWPRNP